jgi:hypothetical protein
MVRRFHANFSYQAGTWTKPRRVIAKVEWHPGELYPRVGFIVTNMSCPAERVVAFYNKRGRQWIKEGKGAIKWTRLSCRTFAANAVRLQLHALAYNLGNFLRTLAALEPIKDWSLTSLKDKLIKIGAKVVSHGRYVIFQMAEVAIARQMFQGIFCRSSRNCGRSHHQRQHETFDSHAFKSNRQESCPRKTILGGSRSYIHVRCHGHAPASHDRFAVHTGDAVVKRDCCRTKADRAVSAHIDRDAGDEHRFLRTSGWPILTVAYRVSSKRIDRHRQLLDQDSFLAHCQFDRGGH